MFLALHVLVKQYICTLGQKYCCEHYCPREVPLYGLKKSYPIPRWSFWFPLLLWRMELNLALHLALFCGHFWHGGECWACLVLSIACRLVEDLALDVSRSWGTYPAYGSLALRVHWSALSSSSSFSCFLFSLKGPMTSGKVSMRIHYSECLLAGSGRCPVSNPSPNFLMVCWFHAKLQHCPLVLKGMIFDPPLLSGRPEWLISTGTDHHNNNNNNSLSFILSLSLSLSLPLTLSFLTFTPSPPFLYHTVSLSCMHEPFIVWIGLITQKRKQ